MTMWRVRHEGSPVTVEMPTAQKVLDGVRDGDWEPTDEVRGPTDTRWQPIEEHPVLAEAVAELEPPPDEPEDDSHLDMNPLIDVALVLLIFFILTATYTTLTRSVELPPEQPDDQKTEAKIPKLSDIQDRIFKVTIRMDGELVLFRIDNKVILADFLEQEMTDLVRNKGKAEALIDVGKGVQWGQVMKVIEATCGAEVRHIYWPKGKN